MQERVPADGIRRHRQRIDVMSDDELVALLGAVEPLPDVDYDDAAWDVDATWDRLELLLAIADAIGERRLVRAIAPLFARARLDDPGDLMQGLRHGPERAVASGRQLAEVLVPLLSHARAGCRRWVVRELGILREPDTLPNLLAALEDPEPRVREETCSSLSMLAQVHRVETIRDVLMRVMEQDVSDRVRREARRCVDRLT